MAEHAAIARPYAQATFELANESGQLDAWSDALHAAGAVVSDDQVASLIGAPGTDNAQLISLIADIAGKSGVAAGRLNNLFNLLVENGRLSSLPEISRAYDSLKAEVENRVEVTLTAASPVDDAQQAKIVDALKKRFGKDVSLTFELDENLIGGARLQADDLVIDGSVSTGLEKLATTLAT
ncbi:MAG: F0F1 ATP synthase subunit delta [Gammaproteobacteria bacterium]|nr:F0F1 ATP synthase subunit delta [Gammaproteobacteria bacterium]MCP4090163.1 F0F1 ATP synthase subunit delta [Gammaproteobacteria bacterium]MCP4277933.1 F0F1 ATP synthase subunit delta [Gammaproteobacteria bacterium]MCP4832528.1 F0F1 ATP synthase subunit delta [Gammaproteobacteria bacterium]MCP4928690.1 F0F1 ATP synthase subunit delta [Gammaproteobacteria bacterium]